jgi:hypothetical protein
MGSVMGLPVLRLWPRGQRSHWSSRTANALTPGRAHHGMARRAQAEVRGRPGLTLTYHPKEKQVTAEARPASIMYVRACPRTDTHHTYMIDIALTAEFSLAVGGAR